MSMDGFIALGAVFFAVMAFAAVVTLSRRLDRAERRRSYEVECLIRSLQALERQQVMLSEQMKGTAQARVVISKIINAATAHGQNVPAGDDPQTGQPDIPAPRRVLH